MGGATSIVFALLSVLANQAGSSPPRRPDIRMDVNLVLVPVTVTDRSGAAVTGLDRTHFRVFEDKALQKIVSFSREEEPVSVGVVFDFSGSMKNKIREAREASRALFRRAHDEDEAFLITFASHPEVQTGFTSDLSAVQEGLSRSRVQGSTALVDAVYLGLVRMRHSRNSRKALVVISDGLDNHSRYTRAELLAIAAESDVQIYTVGIFDPPRNSKGIEMAAERGGLGLLSDLSRATGGLHFPVTGTSAIPQVAERIGTALHNVYMLGYQPPPGGERFRRIQVKATLPNVRLSTRSGYYSAPTGARSTSQTILRP